MKRLALIMGIALFIPYLLISCYEEEDGVKLHRNMEILISIDDFQGNINSRTITDPNNGYSIKWSSGDTIGIFPREGFQEPFEIPTTQIGETTATFDGGHWKIKDGLTYNAYYPFDIAAFKSAEEKTRIPVTYLGQKQDGTECNIGAYDYTYSDWKTANGGSIDFDFHHLGAIVIIKLKYPATANYTRLTINANENVIPVTGTYDLTAEEPTFQANKYLKSLSMDLNNHIGTAGKTGTFYIMMPPNDLSEHTTTLTLTTDVGAKCSYNINMSNILKGYMYEFEGEPTTTSIEGSIDSWGEKLSSVELDGTVFNEKLAEIAGNRDNVTKIIFDANSTPETGAIKISEGIAINFDNGVAIVHIDADQADLTTGFGMFKECRYLTAIQGLDALNTSKSTNMAEMFYYCWTLQSLDLSNFDTSNVTDMSGMFVGCSSLTSLDLSNFDTNKVIDMRWMFHGCISLSSLNVSSFDTSCVTNMASMFYGCSLSSLNVSSFDTSYVTNMASMFAFCSLLTSLDLSNFNTGNVTDMSYMFSGCSNIESIKMGGDIKNLSSYNAILNDINTSGILYYNETYNYDKIINELPNTWTAIPYK